jgi:hypothetical protein
MKINCLIHRLTLKEILLILNLMNGETDMKHFPRLVKRPFFKVGLLCYMALLLCSAPTARAALISASANIDWSTFKITPIDIGNGLPTLTWSTQNDSSSAGLNNCYYCGSNISDNAPNWSSGTLATQTGSTSTFNGSASALTSVSQINADNSINGLFNQSFDASSSQRSGNFTVHGNGLLLFQANYRLAEDVGTTSSASANSNVSFNLNSYNDGGSGSANQNFYRNLYSGSSPVTESGILGVALVFKDGWNGSFTAGASASISGYGGDPNPVPLPASVWLFGSALTGIAALRRGQYRFT